MEKEGSVCFPPLLTSSSFTAGRGSLSPCPTSTCGYVCLLVIINHQVLPAFACSFCSVFHLFLMSRKSRRRATCLSLSLLTGAVSEFAGRRASLPSQNTRHACLEGEGEGEACLSRAGKPPPPPLPPPSRGQSAV